MSPWLECAYSGSQRGKAPFPCCIYEFEKKERSYTGLGIKNHPLTLFFITRECLNHFWWNFDWNSPRQPVTWWCLFRVISNVILQAMECLCVTPQLKSQVLNWRRYFELSSSIVHVPHLQGISLQWAFRMKRGSSSHILGRNTLSWPKENCWWSSEV